MTDAGVSRRIAETSSAEEFPRKGAVADLYDKIREDVPFRKMWAEKSGLGFELPSVVPNVPRIVEKTEAAKAA